MRLEKCCSGLNVHFRMLKANTSVAKLRKTGLW